MNLPLNFLADLNYLRRPQPMLMTKLFFLYLCRMKWIQRERRQKTALPLETAPSRCPHPLLSTVHLSPHPHCSHLRRPLFRGPPSQRGEEAFRVLSVRAGGSQRKLFSRPCPHYSAPYSFNPPPSCWSTLPPPVAASSPFLQTFTSPAQAPAHNRCLKSPLAYISTLLVQHPPIPALCAPPTTSSPLPSLLSSVPYRVLQACGTCAVLKGLSPGWGGGVIWQGILAGIHLTSSAGFPFHGWEKAREREREKNATMKKCFLKNENETCIATKILIIITFCTNLHGKAASCIWRLFFFFFQRQRLFYNV